MRVFLKPVVTAAAAVLLSLCFAVTSLSQSMPGYQAPAKAKDQTPASVKAARGEAPLAKLYGHLNADSLKAKRLAALKKSELPKNSRNEKLHQIGVVRELPSALNPLTDSAIYSVKEGEVRVATVISEGARKLRVQFKDFSLPAGARVFVYSVSDPNVYFGPYEGRGPWGDGVFWTPSMPGEQVIIEYTTPPGNTTAAPFRISQVAHIYKETIAIDDPASDCNVEVTDPWANVKKSVAMLEFISGEFVVDCTGTLLNDSNTSLDAYVLTAHHCISTQSEAQSTFAYWFYDSGETPPSGTASIGFDLAVTGSESDFTLLHRGGVIPGLFYSGWNASPVGAATPVTGIHHPNGSHKRISFGATNSDCAPWLPGPCADFSGVTWSQGTVEPGSSGSGLWTGTPDTAQLVGTLTGGEISCATPTASVFYGRFSVDYPNVSGFLNGACVSGISPTTQGFPEGGGSSSIAVNAAPGCAWTASSAESFVTITSGSTGTGPGTVNFSVAPNIDGLQRRAYVVVGAKVFIVNQAAGGICAPTSIAIAETKNGALSTSDCHAEDHYIDSYSFNGTTGQKIAISLNSGAFDTYLFLLKSDGTVIAENDDVNYPTDTNSRIPVSGYFTLPATDTYTILATSFDPNTTGAYTLSLTEQAKQTLTVASSNPSSGIVVGVFPNDVNGMSTGTTLFTRVYYQNTSVSLNAAGAAGPNTTFVKWQKDGVDYSTSTSIFAPTEADHTMTAVYGPVPTFVLTVLSSNPDSGVPIAISPNDNSGFGSGSTPVQRTYNRLTQVTLTAPISAGSNSYFQKWQDHGSDLTTVRTINVNMNPDRTLTAVYLTVPPLPAPSPTATPNGSGQAVTYQINPTHTGLQFDSTIPPLAQRWSRDLGYTVSYPLIAGGKVFVTTILGLQALDASTGATLWSTGDIGTNPAAAYDAGRVFVINRNGLLRAFDSSTGTQVWTRQLSGQAFTSAPTAAGGTVYITGYPTLYAVSEQDGTIRWSVPNAGGDSSSPAVSSNGVYVAFSCNNTWGLAPTNGSVLWHYSTNCFGGGGRTPVLYAGRLYDRAGDNLVIHSTAGIPVATFASVQAPAFNGSTGYFKIGTTLEARDVISGTLKWSFTGDGTLSSAPIVVNGHVYVGSTSGKLYALNESTGANVWTGNVGASVLAPDEQSSSAPAGLGAGEGLIVVPASNRLVAYQSSPRLMTDSNNQVIALDSVTFVRDPFSVAGLHNFSSDQRTRITIFTTNLGINQPSGDLVVTANNSPLTVEAVGTLPAAPDISYIVVRLDPILTSDANLTVIFHGVTTNSGVLKISP